MNERHDVRVVDEPLVDDLPTTRVPVDPVPAVETVPVVETVLVAPATHEARVTRRSVTISPASVVGGVAAIAMLLFGAINIARAGLDAPLRDPVVEVAGYAGTAVVGIIMLAFGLVLLGASLSRDRAAILFVSIVTGIAGATLAIEPTVGGDLLMAERDLGIALAIASAFVAFVALVAPSVRRTTDQYERA